MAKKKYLVMKARDNDKKSIALDGKTLDFGKKTRGFTITDEARAKEIEAMYGKKGDAIPGEVVVTPLNIAPDRLHPRLFSVPDLPWKKDPNGENSK